MVRASSTDRGLVHRPRPLPGNYFAGPNPIYADAFVDANHNGKDDDGGEHFAFASTINLLRKTQFDGTFNASPEPARKGKPIKVSATLSTADWNDGTWAHIDAPVKIEFKAAGQNSYKTVKTVTATDGQVDTTVTAKRSGTWRARTPAVMSRRSASNGTTSRSSRPSDLIGLRTFHLRGRARPVVVPAAMSEIFFPDCALVMTTRSYRRRTGSRSEGVRDGGCRGASPLLMVPEGHGLFEYRAVPCDFGCRPESSSRALEEKRSSARVHPRDRSQGRFR